MINPRQFRSEIIKPALSSIGLWSQAAENLVLGTAIQESKLTFLRQFGGGPALGLFQMEPATHDDIWSTFIAFRPQLMALVFDLLAKTPDKQTQLESNLFYATAMCRIRYARVSDPLPNADDVDALGAYWKEHYNTPLGAGKAQEWADNYRKNA